MVEMEDLVGREITSLTLLDKALLIGLSGVTLQLYDDGQTFCESRYLQSNDDLPAFVGARFQGVEMRNGPISERRRATGLESLIVLTDQGSFTLVAYNRQNGYFSRFSVMAGILSDEHAAFNRESGYYGEKVR